jgi:hypothetical protein
VKVLQLTPNETARFYLAEAVMYSEQEQFRVLSKVIPEPVLELHSRTCDLRRSI